MISSIIVFVSLILAALFLVVYIASPQFRRKVEQPKYSFMEQLDQYKSQQEKNDDV